MKSHVNSEKLAWLLQRDLCHFLEKYLTELQTEFGVELTLILGDKKEAQTAGEREVLMKDFKMEGIHSCWWGGLEELNLRITALLQEWKKQHSLLQKHHRAIQAHWKPFWKHAFCGAMEPQEIYFQPCSFTIQFSLLCYLLFNVMIYIHTYINISGNVNINMCMHACVYAEI